MNILSVDWDFFYPDSYDYDWGANEENQFMFEAIWHTRCNARNLFTKEHVLDAFYPTIPEGFWERILKVPPRLLIACESHSMLLQILKTQKIKPFNDLNIINMDAHHDMGYWEDQGPCCGSWAWHAKQIEYVKSVHQVYPKWREKSPENYLNDEQQPDTTSFELPEPDNYALVFVCRSGCWTPPWHDREFNDLINSAPTEPTFFDNDIVRMARSPASVEEARVLADEYDAIMKEVMKQHKAG